MRSTGLGAPALQLSISAGASDDALCNLTTQPVDCYQPWVNGSIANDLRCVDTRTAVISSLMVD